MLFGITGLSFIALSLLVLFALGINLLVEGWGPLWQTHEIKSDASGFGRRETVGSLRKVGERWELHLDTLQLKSSTPEAELEKLIGKKVVVDARLPRGTDRELDAETIAVAAPGTTGAIIGTIGTSMVKDEQTREAKRTLVIAPEPMSIEADGEVLAGATDGGRYAVEVTGKPDSGKVGISSIVSLVTKNFFTSYPSRFPQAAGILSAWVGTLLVMFVTMVLAVPLGVAAGVYLEEYAPKNRLTAIIEVNIANLAGVPSIIWGLMALGLFVYILDLGRSVLTAGMTLGLLVLPIVIIATREAIRSIPNTIREAAIGLGATKWQTVRYHILPYSMSGILTGAIIAMSRAIGETAPLVTIGALTFIAFLPPPPAEYRVADADRAAYSEAASANADAPKPTATLHFQPFRWLGSGYTVMPIQLFQWISRPQKAFHENAAAAGIVLLVMTLGLNAVAIAIRYRLRKAIKW